MVNGRVGSPASSMMRWLATLGSVVLLVIGYVELIYLPQKQAIDDQSEGIQSAWSELKNLRSTANTRQDQQRNQEEHDVLRQRVSFLESLVRRLDPKAAKELDELEASRSTTTTNLNLPSTTSLASVLPDQEKNNVGQAAGGKSNGKGAVAFRKDYKCGKKVPGSEGTVVGCDPTGDSPCCSEAGWCGSSSAHCNCNACVDHRAPSKPNDENIAEEPATAYNEETPKYIALVVPFRDRGSHLEKFREKVEALVEYWNKKNVKHTWMVFIVDQFDNELFNRGWLFNVGYKYATTYAKEKGFSFDCVVMHDVDILPAPSVDYGWCLWPNQLSGEIDCWGNSVPYEDSTGGVIALSPRHWVQINGFSNEYHGWGGEDDDLYLRLRQNRLLRGGCHTFCHDPKAKHIPMVHRPTLGQGRFTCLNDGDHTPRQRNQDDAAMWKRLNAMKTNSALWKGDGISSLSIHTAGLPLQSPACETECEAPEDPKPRRRLFGEHWSRVSLKPISEASRIKVMLPSGHACSNEAPELTTIPVGIQHMRRLLPALFEKGCGVTEEWAVQQNFVLVDAKLGQSVLVGSGAPVVVADVALPLVQTKALSEDILRGLNMDLLANALAFEGKELRKVPEREQEYIVQSQRLSQWIRKLPAAHHGWIIVAHAPLAEISESLIKRNRRHPLTVPVCVANAGLEGGGKKFRVTPGSKWCGDGGWTSAEYFTVLRSKSSVTTDKLIPVCIGYNPQYHTYRFERSETGCVGTHRSGTEWTHVGTFHTSKDATGDEVCVGVAGQGAKTRWSMRKMKDCSFDGFSHVFGFRGMSPSFQPPIVLGCLFSAKSKEDQHILSRLSVGNCSSVEAAPGYKSWRRQAKEPTLLAKRQAKSDTRLCFATTTVEESRKSLSGWRMFQDKQCESPTYSTDEKVKDRSISVTWKVQSSPKFYSPADASGGRLCLCKTDDSSSLSERLLLTMSVEKCESPRYVQEFCFNVLSGMDIVKASYLLDEPA